MNLQVIRRRNNIDIDVCVKMEETFKGIKEKIITTMIMTFKTTCNAIGKSYARVQP